MRNGSASVCTVVVYLCGGSFSDVRVEFAGSRGYNKLRRGGSAAYSIFCVQRKENIMLTAGTKAPDFTLHDKDGNSVSLSDFAGRKVVLYFYPKDNTPGCTRQACAFAAAFEEFKSIGAVVVGVSRDSEASHRKFAEKYELPFVLLSDPELEVIKTYDVWQEKKNYGKVSFGVVRTTYVIDENGVIEKAMPKVKPDTNTAEILEYLRG